jgi:putative MATE family efflux protein
MTESPQRIFWRYAIPSITAMLVSGLYQIIDGIFVGHYVGASGLAAINLAWPILFILCGFGILLGMGIGSVISHHRGKKHTHQAQKTLGSGLIMSVLFGLLGSLLLFFGASYGLIWQGATGNLLLQGNDYLQYFGWFGSFTVLGTAMPMLIRNDDRPYFSTGLLITGALLNIVLDYLFIGVFQWGLEGAAIATLCAQAIMTFIAIGYFFSPYARIKLTLKICQWDQAINKKSFSLGSSCLFMYLYISFVTALHNALFLEYGNTNNISAFAIVGYLMSIYYLLSQGIAEGMQPPISYYQGANKTKNLKKVLTLAFTITTITGIAWTAILNLWPMLFIHLFSQNNDVISLTITGIRWHLFAMTLDGLIALSTVYFMSIHQANKALWISLSNMIVQLPFLFLLPKWLGILGIWLAVPISNIVVMVFVAILFINEFKIKQTHLLKNTI